MANNHSWNWREVTRKDLVEYLKEREESDVFPRIPRTAESCYVSDGRRIKYIANGMRYEYNIYIGTYRTRDLRFGPWSQWTARI